MTTEIKPARTRVTQFAKHVGPQRYANHDPRPDLPFEGDSSTLTYDSKDKFVAWILGIAALVILGLDIWELCK